MIFIVLLPTVIFLGIVFVSTYRNRHELRELARSVHNQYVFTEDDREALAESLEEIGSRDPRLISVGVPALRDYAEELKPDWIIGVNVGGRLLSAALARAIGLDASRIVYIHHDPVTKSLVSVPKIDELKGTLLVIDDISRSGGTLRFVKTSLESANGRGNFQLSCVRFAVLVVDATAGEVHADFTPDWAMYVTRSAKPFEFAWTPISEKVKVDWSRNEPAAADRSNPATWQRPLTSKEEVKLAMDPVYAAAELKRVVA
jgi:hypothetical protein